ncbi:reverse transcriptase domain-containing protein [Tanacetum coccineum]|uniref:Reverse transcriptase domain-containing protein n=1 Tax=Tanacetum coccineum TaxID=301880 RepID=A0ABQ5A5U1_9ASTR
MKMFKMESAQDGDGDQDYEQEAAKCLEGNAMFIRVHDASWRSYQCNYNETTMKSERALKEKVTILENVCWKELGLLVFVWIASIGLQIAKVPIDAEAKNVLANTLDVRIPKNRGAEPDIVRLQIDNSGSRVMAMDEGQKADKGVSVKEYSVETVKRGQQVVEVNLQLTLNALELDANYVMRSRSALNTGSFNEFTWYKNKVLHIRLAAYSDQARPNQTFVSTSWRHPWNPILGITLVRMSMMANATPIVTTITKTTNIEKAPDVAPRVNIQDFCKEHYEDILPIIMEKARRDKRKEVQTRLNFGENSKRTRRERENSLNSRAENSPSRFHPERSRTRGHERRDDRNVFSRLTIEGRAFMSDLVIPTRGRPDRFERALSHQRESESPSSRGSESSTSNGGHWKSRTKRRKLADEDDLAEPWTCEDVDPFTPRIRNFKSSRKTRMPNNVKTYDGTGDPEDHLKIFQAAAQVERWAMPTWCHMFNSTLIGAARVWFDELPPESIDGYKGLKAAFLAYFMQQKKYVKDPVEIHNIKQREGETIEDFMERFKVETGRMKGAPECMRIFGFMHGVNSPELTKRLNEHVSKTMEEMMTITTAFIRGEAAAASKKKGHLSWKSQDHSKRQATERKSDFRNHPREGRGSCRFTPFINTPKEILATEAGKFKPPPPMVTPVQKRSSNKFCDFHNDKGHGTDECMQLKKQIEELVRAGKLSHLIKEIKRGRDQIKNEKKEAPTKDKSLAIYMIRQWQRMTRQKLTQSFAYGSETTFPPLADSDGTEGPLVIEAEIGGHMIHRIYIDGGSSTEILYEHCFNQLRPEIRS